MRLFRAYGFRGAVASAHPLASEAGLQVLAEGGTAADAAIAVNAVLNVTQPDACGIGGDLFVLYHHGADRRVRALNASGRSPRRASRQELAARFTAIPPRSAFAVTVPGCVSGWWALHQSFGRLPWQRLLQEAIVLAEEGFPLSRRVAQALRQMWVECWAGDDEARRVFFQEEPREGLRLRQPDLARTLRVLAAEGQDAFYRGDLARRIAAHLASLGHPLDPDDLAQQRPDWVEPLAITYRGREVLTTPPNSQGFAALVMLRLLEREDPERFSGPDDPAWIERVVQAKLAAYRLRDRVLADPETMAREEVEAALRDPEHLLRDEDAMTRPDPDGDTTAFSVADAEGNVLTGIQSLFHGFGSGVIVPGTGILLQSRGSSFRLEPGHANSFEGGRRTAHTLMATLVREGGRPLLSFSTMGADAQPQVTVEVLSAHLDFGFSVEAALAAPRFVHGLRGEPSRLGLERRLPPAVFAALARQYELAALPEYAHETGHAQAIAFEANGAMIAAADPRGDGLGLSR